MRKTGAIVAPDVDTGGVETAFAGVEIEDFGGFERNFGEELEISFASIRPNELLRASSLKLLELTGSTKEEFGILLTQFNLIIR